MSESEYVVDVKPSARRTNGAVGRALHREGRRRTFDSRAEADEWAAELSAAGGRTVWVRDANPDDATGADGYLVGRRPARGDVVRAEGSDGGGEGVGADADRGEDGSGRRAERTGVASPAAGAGEQSSLAAHGREEDRGGEEE